MTDIFLKRHLGVQGNDIREMLKTIGNSDIDTLIHDTIPDRIRKNELLHLPDELSEYEYLNHLRSLAEKNKLFKTYIGLGYYGTITPAVIQRNVLENPSWYTSYTPYQAEISQGRLEALLNFQTVITELTSMELSNCSLLDESTAAAEAMIMMYNLRPRQSVKQGINAIFVDNAVFSHTTDVLRTRAEPLGIEVVQGDYTQLPEEKNFFGAIVQFPDAHGRIKDYSQFISNNQEKGILCTVISDILSLAILQPPGTWGADIAVGSTQRLGIPQGYGGPHAAFLACREKYKRHVPGRIIGLTKDSHGNPALRMALQTREQHIKRERATSNICTAQALLASMAGFYAAYHGPEGLSQIANSIHIKTVNLVEKLESLGYKQENDMFFDTIRIKLPKNLNSDVVKNASEERKINMYYPDSNTVQISLDETTSLTDCNELIDLFGNLQSKSFARLESFSENKINIFESYLRQDEFMKQEVFNRYRSETEMMRYIKKLERRDIGLNTSMIPLGSCTMKLNPAVSLFSLSWPEFTQIHPFVPGNQAKGFQHIIKELESYLCEITGFSGCTLQPNSGASGEYTGLLIMRKYHLERGQSQRKVVLIPSSAHGTNPASAVMAGMKVVVVKCDDKGNIDAGHLELLVEKHSNELCGIMITYPSTHGVFEPGILEITALIHYHGGQVYMDGANMNAQTGLTTPAIIGADVCHLNLHKTFAIPHGGGGPGVGPVCVADHLTEFLPTHTVVPTGGSNGIPAVAQAPWGSASILPISYAYIRMLGPNGLMVSSGIAILNANYLAKKLTDCGYDVLYTGEYGKVGHEFIIDCREIRHKAGITEIDIAKRLIDYGFHAPTVSFPVPGTLMVEPTESESMYELNRFVDAMSSIKQEIDEIIKGEADKDDNVLKNAPHTAASIAGDKWTHPYSREKAVFPAPWIVDNKFWPVTGRADDAFGDRNLVCTCPPTDLHLNES